jgi:acetolactate synthase regulatory subunit
MSAGCWRVKPSEIERTLKSVQKAGLHVASVEVTANGIIKIIVAEAKAETTNQETPESLRRLL